MAAKSWGGRPCRAPSEQVRLVLKEEGPQEVPEQGKAGRKVPLTWWGGGEAGGGGASFSLAGQREGWAHTSGWRMGLDESKVRS